MRILFWFAAAMALRVPVFFSVVCCLLDWLLWKACRGAGTVLPVDPPLFAATFCVRAGALRPSASTLLQLVLLDYLGYDS